ncbi:MAG: AAA family ATPase [Gammaproteobacteria bacterium]|nr:AAA family ATPase [Gammaproteobacteria bacterium]
MKSSENEGERRHVTVLFCDMVDSALLSESLDPEDLRDVMRSYQQNCVDAIKQHGGFVADYLGDGVVAYYGYPHALEDATQCAIYAALDIVAKISQLGLRSKQLGSGGMAVRIGIDTGLVVAGTMGAAENPKQIAVVGEPPNIAARLQAVAGPDTIVVSEKVFRLAKGLFEFEGMGYRVLKGLSRQMLIYKVLRVSGAQDRFDVALTVGLTPLVGRLKEMKYLLGLWSKVKPTQGQIVVLTGEPGVGKTRLVNALQDHLVLGTYKAININCARRFQNSAFYPVIKLLQQKLNILATDNDEEKWQKLEVALVVEGDNSDPDAILVLASLFSLDTGNQTVRHKLSPEEQRRKIQETLLQLLYVQTQRQPILLIVEDLHWIDPSTLALLQLLVEGGIKSSIMLLMTARPGTGIPSNGSTGMVHVDLGRLGAADVESMIKAVSGTAKLPGSIIRGLIEKTDGIPLFVEESTKMVLEDNRLMEGSGDNTTSLGLPSLDIPETLQDLLMTRLDRLNGGKDVAQAGAVVGRNFSQDMVCQIMQEDPKVVKEALNQLESAGLVHRSIDEPGEYSFMHALIRDAAYQSLLKRYRRQYHLRIAQTMEGYRPDFCANQPELIAEHYSQAGLVPEAIEFWLQAGRHATERSANVEAILYSKRGLELLEDGSDSDEIKSLELELQLILGNAHAVTKGYATLEAEKAFSRAKDLCENTKQSDDKLFVALFGLWRFFGTRGDIPVAMKLAQQFMSRAKVNGDPVRLHEANYMLGNTLFMVGDLVRTRSYLEQAIAFQDSSQPSRAAIYGYDLVVASMGYLALALWMLGLPDQSLRQVQAAVVLARSLGHPHSLVIALNFLSRIRQHRQERADTVKEASECLEISIQRRFAYWKAISIMLDGWAKSDQEPENINTIRKAIDAHQAAGAELAHTYFLSMLADACLQNQAWEEGLGCLMRAMNMVHNRGETIYESELYRLRGELLLGQDPSAFDDAQECFQKALDIAQAQKAKGWELRAAISMSRLLLGRGDAKSAIKVLSDLYNGFSEGLGAVDLVQAKGLLERSESMLAGA